MDNHINITSYSASNSYRQFPSLFSGNGGSSSFRGWRSLDTASAVNSPSVLLTADDSVGGGIFAYAKGGAQSAFGSVSVSNPLGLAIDAVGNVYVGANGGTTIEELSPTGSLIEESLTGNHAQSLAVDSAGNLYVAEASGNIVEYFVGGSNSEDIQRGAC